MGEQLHLNVNILNSGVFGGSWRHPDNPPTSAYTIEHYTRVARAAERAKLDAVFLADGPVLDGGLEHRSGNSFEPTVNLAHLSGVTSDIGLVGTLSSSYNDADELAHRLLGVDHLSGGRVGWNVVTTAGAAAARNFGRTAEPAHADRYTRAADVVSRVVEAWDGAADPSPQGRPVVVQAGGSTDGVELAGRLGEVIFSASQTLEEGIAYRARVKAVAERHGRRPEDVVVLPGVSTVVAATEEEARRRRATLAELVPWPYATARLSAQLGFDVSAHDPDALVPLDLLPEPDDADGSQTFYRLVLGIVRRERPTFRALLDRLGGGAGHRIVVGTPEQVADDLETWFRAGGADGFNVMPDVLPSGFDDFAEGVVPVLQARGLFRREYDGSTLRAHLGLPVRPLPLTDRPLATTW
ncbi:nitrilotriacetate monooxygenase [Cellulomonas chitinilytica]|uniref:Nitrilotriacetate monooxygenase n=1 Tax=Cellulomonas chitinilytica TaxID=398759 RepID=A0A919NYP8_9CELL|nr:LLM class flavin-dependent oxidoreductase [Cellulomonas chitinilytica]GIG19977.1 nitrilotriacetate monooxygenase [Cellulomonas chitinilytica]